MDKLKLTMKGKAMKSTKSTNKKTNLCIVCNDNYGIYYGDVISFNSRTRVATVKNCRHVARWYGMTGGITSLATHGLCGPRASESRVGAPTDSPAILTGIVNLFPVSKNAALTFDASIPHV